MKGAAGIWKLALGALGGGALLAVVGLTAVSILDYAGWPWNLMRNQVTIRAQEGPALGSAPGAVPFNAGPWPLGNEPLAKTSRSIQEGERVYTENCVFCHGPGGRGKGPLAPKLRDEPEDLTSWRVHYRKDRDLFDWIVRPGKIMPPFEHRLKDEEIWSVVHYIQESFRPAEPPPWRAAEEAALGEELYEALSCAQCHGPDRLVEASGIPPSLASAGSKLKKPWVVDYLMAPRRIRWRSEGSRPATRMPAFSLTRREAEALAEHLSRRVDRERFPPGLIVGTGSIEEGREAFETYQCMGCHALDGEGNRIGPDLSDVGSRLQPEYLYQFLLDPQAVVPGTSMRNMDLWEDEARALVRYLQTVREGAYPATLKVGPEVPPVENEWPAE